MDTIDYGVIILNYKTAIDAINAAKSVIENSISENYRICIVDADSSEGTDVLSQCVLQNTETLFLQTNKGYAYGNNMGIRFLAEKYDVKYIVIMNPDVLILEKSTIEDIIKHIQNEKNCIGGQPLVWTPYIKKEPNVQINVNRVFSYFDFLVESVILLKILFKKIHKRNIYGEKMPYMHSFTYEVPSGAFFIINYKFFESIHFFDERTFLYGEERILGYKVKERGKKFVFDPKHKVIHEQGKSTGSDLRNVSKKAFEEGQKSALIYLKYYLKVGKIKIFILMTLRKVNFYINKIVFRIFRYKRKSKYENSY